MTNKKQSKPANNLPTRLFLTAFFAAVLLLAGCREKKTVEEALLPSARYHYVEVDTAKLARSHLVYVPIYSEIYDLSGHHRQSLTATLSVRNAHVRDTMYVHEINYFDSQGKQLRSYLKKDIMLLPLEAAEFVVEHKEKEGGVGACFVVHWSTDSEYLQSVIQAVMLSTLGQQGISFLSEGVTVETTRR
jgi:hypothetical protein